MLQAQPGRAAAAEGPHMQPPAAAFQLHPWAVSLGTPQKQLRTANRPYATHSPLNYFHHFKYRRKFNKSKQSHCNFILSKNIAA